MDGYGYNIGVPNRVVHEQPMVTNHGGGRDGYYRRKDDDPAHEQPMVTNHGGRIRPNRDGRSAPPLSHDSSLTKPMNEIVKVIEYLKEAEGKRERITTPTSFGPPGFKIIVPKKSLESYPAVTTVKAAVTVTDSNEAMRRNGKLNNHNKSYGKVERENHTTYEEALMGYDSSDVDPPVHEQPMAQRMYPKWSVPPFPLPKHDKRADLKKTIDMKTPNGYNITTQPK